MNNQAFSKIWILFIVVIFIVGGIFIWQFQQPAEEESELPETEKPEVEIQEGKVNEALSICAKIKDAEKKNICTGIVNGDLETCESLSEGKRLNCYVSLGRRTGNSSICERFGSEGLKYECLARLTEDYDKCEKSILESYCYYDVAILKGDSSGCEKITDEELNNKCLAYLERNSNYCQNISQEIGSSNCYVHVAMLGNDSSVCQKPMRYKDLCQSMVARNISGLNCEAYGGYCEFFAGFTGDDSVCQKMISGDYCYHDAAMGLLGVYPPEVPRGW